MSLLRRILLRLLAPILHLLGERLRRRKTGDYHLYLKISRDIRPGDVIVTRRRGLVAWLIPGYWSHAAMYIGRGDIVHAVYPTVTSAKLAELVMKNDDAALLRARFASSERAASAAGTIDTYVGKPYDLGFGPGKDAFYCSEAIWHAYKTVTPEWTFTARQRLGVATVTPQDLHDAVEHFDKIA